MKRWAGILLLALVILPGSFLLKPVSTADLQGLAAPSDDYAAALAQVSAIQAAEAANEALNPICHTRLLANESPTERVIVLFHGVSNCPRQFWEFGELLHAQGYTVFIPRIPHHGLKDRLTTEQAKLTANEFIAYGNQAVDIAQGLGDEVTVVGLSGGGILTGWLIHHRPDIAQAMVIAPSLGTESVPADLTPAITTLFSTLPNQFRWWNPELKADAPGPQHGYPRFSSRAMAEVLRLGIDLQRAARAGKPHTNSIIVVTNASDRAVNPALIERLVENWRAQGVPDLRTYEFEADLNLNHDIIDRAQKTARIEVVYPVLLDLLTGEP